MRKQFAKELSDQKVENEKLSNLAIERAHTGSLQKMETDILGDRLKVLTDSIQSIGSAKVVEDRMQILLEKKQKDNEYQKSKVDSLQKENIHLN